ncbi:MAG: hypothetical protein SGI74_02415 [Oligoflexia bacterium]|nr:hypothetical protein [Oligoflexia bacterium]
MHLIFIAMTIVIFSSTTQADAIKACENAKVGMSNKKHCEEEAAQSVAIQCSEGLPALKAIMPIQNKCYDKAKAIYSKNKEKIKTIRGNRLPASDHKN